MTVLESLEKNWAAAMAQGNFFIKFFGNYKNTAKEVIEESKDFNCGAVVNEIEFARKSILEHVQNRSVNETNHTFPDFLIPLVLGWKRGHEQSDEDYIRDFMMIMNRGGEKKRVTKAGIFNVVKEMFQVSYIIESLSKYQRLPNNYFETGLDGWETNASLSEEVAFRGVSSVLFPVGESKYLSHDVGVSFDMTDDKSVIDYPYPAYAGQEKADTEGLKAAKMRLSFFSIDGAMQGAPIVKIAVKSLIGDQQRYIDFAKMERLGEDVDRYLLAQSCTKTAFSSGAHVGENTFAGKKWQHNELVLHFPVSQSDEQFFVEIISDNGQSNVYIDNIELFTCEENPCFSIIAKQTDSDIFYDEDGQKWRGAEDAQEEIAEREGEDAFNGVNTDLNHPDYVYSSKKIDLPWEIDDIKRIKKWKYKTWHIGAISRTLSRVFIESVIDTVKAAGTEYEIRILT